MRPTRDFARRAGLRRSVGLLSSFRFEQSEPARFYGALAEDTAALVTDNVREFAEGLDLAEHDNVTTLLGEAIRLDADARRVTTRRPDDSTFELEYDYLVIAAGMRQSYFGKEEFAAWAPGMKTVDDALELRSRILGCFEQAEITEDDEERRRLLTFIIVGAGLFTWWRTLRVQRAGSGR